MLRSLGALALLTAPAAVLASDVVTVGMTGGWSSSNVTESNTELLVTALSGSDYANGVGETRVCFTAVTALETQVVAGTNYRFYITGCDLTGGSSDGECSDDQLDACTPASFVVKVYEQSWTDTLEVTAITEEATATSSSGSSSVSVGDEDVGAGTVSTADTDPFVVRWRAVEASPEEQDAIDAWIDAQGLNQYGDGATTMYTGGTPLFDETTGTTINRYDYILSRHPDRPWIARGKETEFESVAAVDEPVGPVTDGLDAAATKMQSRTESSSSGTMGMLLSMLGLVTMGLAGVAVFKMRHARRSRRFRYNRINSREA